MQKLEFHYDAGHGWLKVPKVLYKKVMGNPQEESLGYSYQDEDNYYLEEDCDCPDFLKKYLGEDSKDWNKHITEIDDGDDSFIRNLQRGI